MNSFIFFLIVFFFVCFHFGAFSSSLKHQLVVLTLNHLHWKRCISLFLLFFQFLSLLFNHLIHIVAFACVYPILGIIIHSIRLDKTQLASKCKWKPFAIFENKKKRMDSLWNFDDLGDFGTFDGASALCWFYFFHHFSSIESKSLFSRGFWVKISNIQFIYSGNPMRPILNKTLIIGALSFRDFNFKHDT